ncbi:MAG: NAD(P)H-binding protein [Pseudomonadota bacterium]
MKLAIFGASGATGRHLVAQALARGHRVTALARHLDSLPIVHARLQVVLGHMGQPDTVQQLVAGQDAVFSVLGVRGTGPVTVCSDGARAIVAAMRAAGTRRLIALSAYGASETGQASLMIRLVRAVLADKMRDKDAMEALVRASGLDWTLVRPPLLTNGKPSARYRAASDWQPGPFASIARADLAHFMLNGALGTDRIGAALNVSN